ncbi:MAG: hypothetical protein D6725_11820, partial [Planctomycetota bacterium]
MGERSDILVVPSERRGGLRRRVACGCTATHRRPAAGDAIVSAQRRTPDGTPAAARPVVRCGCDGVWRGGPWRWPDDDRD